MFSRRTVLAATTALVAGCADSTSDGDPAGGTPDKTEPMPTPTRTEPAPTAATDEPISLSFGESAEGVSLVDWEHRYAFYATRNVDWLGVEGDRSQQYAFVVVDASTAETPPPRSAFRLVDDTGWLGPWTDRDGVRGDLLDVGVDAPAYHPDDSPRGWLGFELSRRYEGTPWVELDEAWAWELPGDLLAAFRRPGPRFEVRSFDTPESVPRDEHFDVSVTVENVGEGDGTFRGALNHGGSTYFGEQIEASVAAGAEETVTRAVYDHVGAESPLDEYLLRLDVQGPEDYERRVELEG